MFLHDNYLHRSMKVAEGDSLRQDNFWVYVAHRYPRVYNRLRLFLVGYHVKEPDKSRDTTAIHYTALGYEFFELPYDMQLGILFAFFRKVFGARSNFVSFNGRELDWFDFADQIYGICFLIDICESRATMMDREQERISEARRNEKNNQQ